MSLSHDDHAQAFPSSEALKSHQKKHCLSLRLTADPPDDSVPSRSDFASPPALPSLREEMPTPRRFLIEFEQNSAFLDDIVVDGSKRRVTSSPIAGCITENPFAETFRRASFSKEPVVQSNELQVPHESESLNTPSIQLNVSNENPLAHLSRRSISEESGRESPPSHLHHKLPVISEPSIIKQALKTADIPLNVVSLASKSNTLIHASDSKGETDLLQTGSDAKPDTVSDMGCVSSTGSQIEVHVLALPAVCPQVPAASRASARKRTTPVRRGGRILPKPVLTAAPVVQVKTSDVKSFVMPVASAVVTSVPKPAVHPLAATAQSICILNLKPAPTTNFQLSNTDSKNRSLNTTRSREKTPPLTASQLLKPGRKKKGQRVPDASERRRQSLDRNREAAQRCRLKKKQWAQEAEERADTLMEMNNRLQVRFLIYVSLLTQSFSPSLCFRWKLQLCVTKCCP